MNILEFFKPTRKKIITFILFRALMVLPYVIIEHFLYGPNPNTPAFIISGIFIFFLTSIVNPYGMIISYLIVCLLVEKIKKDHLKFLIIVFLSLAWLIIQTFAMGVFVLPIL